MDVEPIENIWVRMSRQIKVGDITVYLPQTMWSRSRWCLLQTTGRSLTFTGPGPHGGFNNPDICCKCNIAGHKHPGHFWSALMVMSWQKWLTRWQGQVPCWTSYPLKQKLSGGSLGSCDQKLVALMDEQGSPDKTEVGKGSKQEVEAVSGHTRSWTDGQG